MTMLVVPECWMLRQSTSTDDEGSTNSVSQAIRFLVCANYVSAAYRKMNVGEGSMMKETVIPV
jgi:hypothetical protein